MVPQLGTAAVAYSADADAATGSDAARAAGTAAHLGCVSVAFCAAHRPALEKLSSASSVHRKGQSLLFVPIYEFCSVVASVAWES